MPIQGLHRVHPQRKILRQSLNPEIVPSLLLHSANRSYEHQHNQNLPVQKQPPFQYAHIYPAPLGWQFWVGYWYAQRKDRLTQSLNEHLSLDHPVLEGLQIVSWHSVDYPEWIVDGNSSQPRLDAI